MTEVERLSALISAALANAEARSAAGEVITASELNALRRLVEWGESQREFAEVRELTRGRGD